MIKGLTPYQILGKLTNQRKKEMTFGKKDQRRQVSSYIKRFMGLPRRTYVHQRSTRSLWNNAGYIDVFSQKDGEMIRIIAVSCWILKTWRFKNQLEGLVPGWFGTSKGRKAVYLSLVSPLDANPDPKKKPQALPPHEVQSWPVVCDRSGRSALFAGILSDSEAVPSEFLKKIINLKDGSEMFGEEELQRGSLLPRKRVDTTTDSWGKLPGITQNKKQFNLDSWEQSPAKERSWKRTKAAKSMFNVIIDPITKQKIFFEGCVDRWAKNE